MKIYVTMKSVSRRKDYLNRKEFVLKSTPQSLRQLITEIIALNVEQLNEKKLEKPFLHFLTNEEIVIQSSTGKVGFDTKYNENKSDEQEAVNTAIQAFRDGLFKVFLNEKEQEALDIPLLLQDGDEVVFIRLTMLTGRMW
ncbi:hypothetical protein BKP45_10295 [Anaerobacillus alkalidiazotrophicus]|uniref:Uncharacterized protein n=1 Tax=Anaerobacillus alkalidiazotrophicus TaxID=472963 RepID=A0A1S2M5W2_9BACI|nr:hypothetical protein [Anaerobacillus alkalidiazotrophicus]OIJ20162.1 hypothetical protein BKP45_10295 [Anaerobacillus alkalidiazotrophicus]